MSTEQLEAYAFAYFLGSGVSKMSFDGGYHRLENFVQGFEAGARQSLDGFGQSIAKVYPAVAQRVVDRALNSGSLSPLDDEVAGVFYRFNQNVHNKCVEQMRSENEILRRASLIGDKFWEAAFATLAGDPERNALPSSDLIPIPASDRIVTLSDNSRAEIQPRMDELIQRLENSNGDPDAKGLQERILGQVKAGNELIKVGSLRAYALYVTLVAGLVELINRYRDSIIASAAYDLLIVLAKHVYGIEI